MHIRWWPIDALCLSGAQAAVSASQCLYFLFGFRGLSEEEGTGQELQQQFQLPNVFRRGGNKSGAAANVPASQCF
jgi:hypothetical protein